MIRHNRLQATKVGGRWFVELGEEATPQRDPVSSRKHDQLRDAVDRALDSQAERGRRYSLRDLKAFQVVHPLYLRAIESVGLDHPATAALREMIELLSCGCHRFDHAAKAQAYGAARDAASRALCELILVADAPKSGDSMSIADLIEQDLMPALAGLLRRVDRKRRWS